MFVYGKHWSSDHLRRLYNKERPEGEQKKAQLPNSWEGAIARLSYRPHLLSHFWEWKAIMLGNYHLLQMQTWQQILQNSNFQKTACEANIIL